MFKKNEDYKQYELFSIASTLSKKQSKLLRKSIEHNFLINIFSKINESDFEVLYSNKKSRPNTPVNQLVGSLILKHLFNWTYDDLFRNLNFNILTRHALGIQSLDYNIFSEASIFNFQNRISEHFITTGQDLLSQVFDSLTKDQLNEFGIKTDIQRGDSFLVGSNIFDYTRLQLLVEVLLRFLKMLEKEGRIKLNVLLEKYTKQTAGQYIYRIQKEDLPKEMNQLSEVYHDLYTSYKDSCEEKSIFKIFERVYYEHFIVIDNKVNIISSNQLHSGILTSPDDTEATYRYKRRINSKGYSGHISETANPTNKINLITDVVLEPNNIHDATILEKRLPEMLDKTPDLSEYHCDGAYGNAEVDKIMEKNDIAQIQAAIPGRKAFAEIKIIEKSTDEYWVSCENGQLCKAEKTEKAWRVKFDTKVCSECPLNEICATSKHMRKKTSSRLWYFGQDKILLDKRKQNFEKLPKEKRKIRANVEATVKEMKRGIKNGKLRVRGQAKAVLYIIMTAIAVNLTRIHKYSVGIEPISILNAIIYTYFNLIMLAYHPQTTFLQKNQHILTQFKNAA